MKLPPSGIENETSYETPVNQYTYGHWERIFAYILGIVTEVVLAKGPLTLTFLCTLSTALAMWLSLW